MSISLPSGSDSAGAPVQDEHDALPPGTRLGEFEVLKVLGIGGFGIVYLAQDHALERLVAVKEYMPSMMAARGKGTQVSLRSSLHKDTFTIGLRSFVNEAKLLARFNHPSLVKVYRFWEDNGTAYMAMPFYPGRTLKEERLRMSEVPSEAWLRALVDPLLGAMEVLHKENVYHRDIAPDNILLLPDGPPVLLDFGAARSVIGDRTQSLTAVLKPSYAPIEQYADVGHLRQGAWTDLYALGAVLHFVVMGRPPTPSASRAVHDEQPLLTSLGAERTGSMPEKILKAIDWALTVSPHTRPQSVQQFRDALDGRLEPPTRTEPGAAAGLRQEPSRAAPSGWAETFHGAGAEDGNPPGKETSERPASTEASGALSAATPSADDATIIMTPGGGGASAAHALASAPPPDPAGAIQPKTRSFQSDALGSPGDPSSAMPHGTGAATDSAVQAQSSRALPPLFASEPAQPSGPFRAGRVVMVMAAAAVLALGVGGWLLKDRILTPTVQTAPTASVAMPASAVWMPQAASSPSLPAAATQTASTGDAVPASAASAAAMQVPDWSSQTARPAGTAASSSAAAVAPSKAEVAARVTPPVSRRLAKTTVAVEPAASTPSQVCAARASGTMANCMRRVCTQGALYDHPHCVDQRRSDEW